ncbi:MAG: hypothetical protein KDD38_10690 [Bdellovibrionales bacterium]|nr:hypothetical protein [Bdellovibrionales bacterium]
MNKNSMQKELALAETDPKQVELFQPIERGFLFALIAITATIIFGTLELILYRLLRLFSSKPNEK